MNDDQQMAEYHGDNNEVVHYRYQANRKSQQKRNELMAALS